MSEPLIIVGAGGHGRETAYAFLREAHASCFLGFLDDISSGTTPEGWPILGRVGDAPKHSAARFVVAVNDPRARRALVARLHALGVTRWGSVIHPEIRLHASVSLGAGCSLLGGCQLTTNIRVGDHCIVNRGAHISHDCTLGDFCSLNPSASVAGSVSIASGTELGSGCVIRQRITIGPGATIGMGSIVVKDVADNSVVVGNPARVLRSNPPWLAQ